MPILPRPHAATILSIGRLDARSSSANASGTTARLLKNPWFSHQIRMPAARELTLTLTLPLTLPLPLPMMGYAPS